MKTSNKILIGLLSTILFVMMAIFLDIRIFGERYGDRTINVEKYQKQEVLIGDFAHIHLSELKAFRIANSDKNYIESVVYNDTSIVNINYSLTNDTLKINGNSLPTFAHYTLYVNSVIESISAEHSEISISGINQDSIYFNVTDGMISSFKSGENDFPSFDYPSFRKVMIKGINSSIYFREDEFYFLELNLENSNAEFRKDINTVNASLKSNSQLHLKNVEKLELAKDKTSRIYMR